MMKKPVLLLILDGWGIRQEADGNAIKLAPARFYESMLANYPNVALDASGEAVGLPDHQMGNSEVGHLNMGAGRVVYQDITKINKSIRDGDFFTNPIFLSAVQHIQQSGGTLHLMGLLSDGGVHSCLDHLMALLDFCKQQGLHGAEPEPGEKPGSVKPQVRVHAFLDGRDVPPQSAEIYLKEVEEKLLQLEYPQISTISGRYYAMDRDKRWERTQQAYENLVEASGRKFLFSVDALHYSYAQNVHDEFVVPCVTDATYEGMQDGDAVLFFNFRPDRARQLTAAFTLSDFNGFDRCKCLSNFFYACMTLYDESFNLPIAFPKQNLSETLAQVISEHGLKQLHTAETEKYAHVTYFFNGGVEQAYPGEDRTLVPSPRVATYDLQPAMSVAAVTDVILEAIHSNQYDFIVANFANPDMVGHTGILAAAEEAVQSVDECLKKIVEALLPKDGVMLLTADHGNCETMIDEHGGPHTAHTTNLVPLILVSNHPELQLDTSKTYSLSDVSPTILQIMNLPQPPQMTSPSILKVVKPAGQPA